MGKNFNIAASLRWRTPDNKLVLVEHNEGATDAYVSSHLLNAAGLRALAAAALDVANHIEGHTLRVDIGASAGPEEFGRILPETDSTPTPAVTPVVLPERPVIGVVPASAIQAQAVSAPVPIPPHVAVKQQPGEDTEDLGPPIEVRRAPRAPQGPLPGAPPRAVNVYPSGGYGI